MSIAFIDLRQALDTVWPIGLFYKHLKQNVPSKIYYVIFSMYNDTTCRIDFNNWPLSISGMKKGNVLSNLLFNYFIDDVIQKLRDKKHDPEVLGNTTISILSYADDIVLISENKEGFQNCLDTLYDYCTLWNLQVNDDKSKIIVLNSKGITFPK